MTQWSTHGPRYVERGGELVYRQPYLERVRMTNFVIHASADHLDAFYDRYFNEPSRGSECYRAIGPLLLLNFVETAEAASDRAPDSFLGATSYTEVGIWAPLLDLKRGRVALSVPYMFVDLGASMATGREIYGYPKQLARIQIVERGGVPEALAVDTFTLGTFGPHARAREERVLTVRRDGEATDPASLLWDDLGAATADLLRLERDTRTRLSHLAAAAIDRLPRDWRATLEQARGLPDLVLLALMRAGRVPMRLLKQFRAAENPEVACYQAIVEVGQQVTAFHGGGPLSGDYELTVADLDSQPIRRELGLPPGPQRPFVAFWLEFDFLVDYGEVLWRASGG